jgi:ferredoxin
MPEYTVTLDEAACDGIFACLVRDDRFAEADDGLATIDASSSVARDAAAETLTVSFDDDRRASAEEAAAACPVDAITIADGAVADSAAAEEDA